MEDCAVKMLQTYDMLVKAKREYEEDPADNDDVRVLVVLDSIGALSSDKLINDAVKKDQMVADMGSSAKLRNNLMRGLMMRVPISGATLLIINHVYDDPSALFGASKIKQMGGGKGLEYASHLILQCEKLLVKAGNDEFLVGGEDKETVFEIKQTNSIKYVTLFSDNFIKFCPNLGNLCKIMLKEKQVYETVNESDSENRAEVEKKLSLQEKMCSINNYIKKIIIFCI